MNTLEQLPFKPKLGVSYARWALTVATLLQLDGVKLVRHSLDPKTCRFRKASRCHQRRAMGIDRLHLSHRLIYEFLIDASGPVLHFDDPPEPPSSLLGLDQDIDLPWAFARLHRDLRVVRHLRAYAVL
jgi:hypothetical protein